MNREGQIAKHRFSRVGVELSLHSLSTVKSHSITWAERESANHERRSGPQSTVKSHSITWAERESANHERRSGPQSTVKSHSITWAERESANHERRSGPQLCTQTFVLRSETGGGSQISETMIPSAIRKLHSDSRRCLRHPSFTHCRVLLRHTVHKTVS